MRTTPAWKEAVSSTGAATLAIFANVVGLMVFLRISTDRLLSAVLDPLHPDWTDMQRAFAGYTLYAVSLFGVLAVGLAFLGAFIAMRARSRDAVPAEHPRRRLLAVVALAALLTAVVVLVLIEVLLFQDYGVHFYEFDVVGILADAAFRRDLGIQPAEVLRVTGAALSLLVVEVVLCMVAIRIAPWREGALARACTAAMIVAVPGGLGLFRLAEAKIATDRADFAAALPFGDYLLFRSDARPFIPSAPRLGAGGYPVMAANDSAPVLTRRSNVVFFVADGLRGDMIAPRLTPNLLSFGSRPDVIHSRRHFSTGHVSEAGIFGLVYSLRGQAFHSFIEARVPPYPLAILKRNGYHTFLLASSRLSPYPSDQLVKAFDEVSYPLNDDEAIAELARYVAARRADGQPYFVLAFMYTPHYPFTSAKAPFRKFPSVGPKARTNYMNDVLQADDYFRQTAAIVGDDYDRGRTVLVATADHGEEIRDHGVFGHASPTFWNEKIVVPFFLGLPGERLTAVTRAPELSTHTDVWPTIFDYLGATPRIEPGSYSDGRSLLAPPGAAPAAYVSGRYFPYADKPGVLTDGRRKYWFRVAGVGAAGRLCYQITRVTDMEDRSLPDELARAKPASVAAFAELQSTFWRFIRFTGPQTAPCSGD